MDLNKLPIEISEQIEFPSDCWPWRGYISDQGYGGLKLKGRRVKAHKVVYELLIGPVPEGLELDHLCRYRHCVNPAHLEPVPHATNCQRGQAGARQKELALARTHCRKGHPYSDENVYRSPSGKRECRECKRLSRKEPKVNQLGWKETRAKAIALQRKPKPVPTWLAKWRAQRKPSP